ncbi:hypothetical protein CesoFtcFv8_027680 [Champsocephalus esox]|uniref:Uncharacterized protein n=1 Tax=Champsocephalus esox TaxID=159716 RepID=A0AAN8AYY5_9TELE|nr:hypothetical protein CesoFtcFv8_027680 [Champsocephalus esox]
MLRVYILVAVTRKASTPMKPPLEPVQRQNAGASRRERSAHSAVCAGRMADVFVDNSSEPPYGPSASLLLF